MYIILNRTLHGDIQKYVDMKWKYVDSAAPTRLYKQAVSAESTWKSWASSAWASAFSEDLEILPGSCPWSSAQWPWPSSGLPRSWSEQILFLSENVQFNYNTFRHVFNKYRWISTE